ncbi:MAG: hypothetical protein PHU56_03750 [Candidatus Pacebacteria bacterium]|nr:hypothetical protein [Candidatus Paceibacterota bacterium]
MGKVFRKFLERKLNAKAETAGQVRDGGRFDKLFAAAGRRWGLATKLEHIKNRGRQNKK